MHLGYTSVMSYSYPLETSYGLTEVEVLTADRLPCAVCGHPTGDCPGEHPLTGIVEPKRNLADPLATFIVPERIYEEEIVNGRTYRRLIYAVGDRIRMEEARRIGLIS